MNEIVSRLIALGKTISFMESCTGGYITSSLTDIEDASKVLRYSAITYSNEYKEKMGVSKEIIDQYSVYSIETAMEMSKVISIFANSDYGVGITGNLKETKEGKLEVFISIYDRVHDSYDQMKIHLEE